MNSRNTARLSSSIRVSEPKLRYINCESSIHSEQSLSLPQNETQSDTSTSLPLQIPDSKLNRLLKAYEDAGSDAIAQSQPTRRISRVPDLWNQKTKSESEKVQTARRSLLQRPDFERLSQLPPVNHFDSRRAKKDRKLQRAQTNGI